MYRAIRALIGNHALVYPSLDQKFPPRALSSLVRAFGPQPKDGQEGRPRGVAELVFMVACPTRVLVCQWAMRFACWSVEWASERFAGSKRLIKSEGSRRKHWSARRSEGHLCRAGSLLDECRIQSEAAEA